MASINVEEKGGELHLASLHGKKDEVKAMIKALSDREELTQVLNWQNVSNVLSSRKEPPHTASYWDRGTGGRRCTGPSTGTD